MHKITKVGVGLMALGVGVSASWSAWTRTRKIEPLDVEVKVAAGQSVAKGFKLNYDGLYLIELSAERAGEAQLAAIDAEWGLWSCGQEVKKGSTNEVHSAPGGSRDSRVIGDFNGRAGQSYELQVKFNSEAPGLGQSRPRLKVVVSGLARENLQAANVLAFSTMFICELFGMVLVGIGIWGRRAAGEAL